MKASFSLIETMRFDNGIEHLARHLERLQRAARTFNIPVDGGRVARRVEEECSQPCVPGGLYRVRVAVDRFGRVDVRVSTLAPLQPGTRSVVVSDSRIDERSVYRRHKTSVREPYDDEYRRALSNGHFEVLFCNTAGRLAEGSRTNLFANIGGQLLTPPVEEGALPGIRRAIVLEQQPGAGESRLTPADLKRADALFVCNAVIGMVEVQLIDSEAG